MVTELVVLTESDFRRWFSLANKPVSSPSEHDDIG